MNVDRRAFLKATAGTVAASWWFPSFHGTPLLAEAGPAGNAIVAPDYPLNSLQPWVESCQLPTGAFAAQQAQTLKYDWRFWNWEQKKMPLPTVMLLGTVTVQRKPSASGIEYQIDQVRDRRQMTAKVNCAADEIESVRDWTLDEAYPVGESREKEKGGKGAHAAQGEEGPREKFTCQSTGKVDGANIHLAHYGREKVVPLDSPLICSWALMCNPQIVRSLSTSRKKFTLADQMSLIRVNYQARPDVQVSVASAACDTFLITGSGATPTHQIIDPRVGSLFMTQHRVSMVLTSIENAV